MRSLGHPPAEASFGSKDIGRRRVTVTSGSGDIGSALPLKGRTGRIRTTTTIAKAGNGTKEEVIEHLSVYSRVYSLPDWALTFA